VMKRGKRKKAPKLDTVQKLTPVIVIKGGLKSIGSLYSTLSFLIHRAMRFT
jgi:hypothetical protein